MLELSVQLEDAAFDNQDSSNHSVRHSVFPLLEKSISIWMISYVSC
jgi:hypothetical protein